MGAKEGEYGRLFLAFTPSTEGLYAIIQEDIYKVLVEASDYELNNTTDAGDQICIGLLDELVVGTGCP